MTVRLLSIENRRHEIWPVVTPVEQTRISSQKSQPAAMGSLHAFRAGYDKYAKHLPFFYAETHPL